MVASRIFKSRFKNQYGDVWEFEYDPLTGEGLLRGSDVDWREYCVFNGHASELVLNDEELRWLRNAWEEAIARP